MILPPGWLLRLRRDTPHPIVLPKFPIPRPPEPLQEPVATRPPLPANTAAVRVELSALQLRSALKLKARAGHATPQDLQLLAALDRWSAGELV